MAGVGEATRTRFPPPLSRAVICRFVPAAVATLPGAARTYRPT